MYLYSEIVNEEYVPEQVYAPTADSKADDFWEYMDPYFGLPSDEALKLLRPPSQSVFEIPPLGNPNVEEERKDSQIPVNAASHVKKKKSLGGWQSKAKSGLSGEFQLLDYFSNSTRNL